MQAFSPRETVSELDRFIIGQDDAKKAVAIALRNRWRRQQLEGEIKEEILPKNILMVGPTASIKSIKFTPLTTRPLSTSKHGIILFFNIFILEL